MSLCLCKFIENDKGLEMVSAILPDLEALSRRVKSSFKTCIFLHENQPIFKFNTLSTLDSRLKAFNNFQALEINIFFYILHIKIKITSTLLTSGGYSRSLHFKMTWYDISSLSYVHRLI